MGRKSGIGTKKVSTEIDSLTMMDNLFSFDALNLFDSDSSLIATKTTVDEEERQEALFFHHKPNKREFTAIKANEYLSQVLTGLPTNGETIHCISNSRFDFWSFIPSVIGYLDNYTTKLYISTWTTNNRNTQGLIELYDQGKIGAIQFVVGNYFKVREAPVYNYLATKLMERKQLLISGEHHLKVLLLQNQENYIVVESSANLTSNPRTEQFTYNNDRDLFHFYKSWFDSLAQKEEKTPNEQRK